MKDNITPIVREKIIIQDTLPFISFHGVLEGTHYIWIGTQFSKRRRGYAIRKMRRRLPTREINLAALEVSNA